MVKGECEPIDNIGDVDRYVEVVDSALEKQSAQRAATVCEGPVPAPAAPERPTSTPTPTAKPIYHMTPDELSAAERADKAKDDQLLVQLFGADGAKKYQQLQRIANSTNRCFEETDAASDEVLKMEGRLTPEQQNQLFRIDQPKDTTREDYREYRNALDRIGGDTAEELGSSMRWAITKLGDVRDPALMNPEQQLAFAQLRHGFGIADNQGWDKDAVLKSALTGAAARFSDPSDAAFMLRQFMRR